MHAMYKKNVIHSNFRWRRNVNWSDGESVRLEVVPRVKGFDHAKHVNTLLGRAHGGLNPR